MRARRRRAAAAGRVDVLLGAGVIAGTANLLNLLDLRPGRALKAGLLLGAPLAGGPARRGRRRRRSAPPPALLPADLDEEIMLGDTGANALGALLGVALAARTGPAGRAGAAGRARRRSPRPARRSASPRSSRTRRGCASSTRWAGGRPT